MFVATSRFRVANGMEAQVRAAFVERPRFVDTAPGFLGMETFTDRSDPAVFLLVTRWVDHGSYARWHHGADHQASHAWIPKGLKLDAAATSVVELERIEPDEGPTGADRVRDAAGLIARTLEQTARLYVIAAGLDGTLRSCNPAASAALGVRAVGGDSIWPVLTGPSAQLLRARLVRGKGDGSRFLLNFVGPDGMPTTFHCEVEIDGDSFLLIGDGPAAEDSAAQAALAGVTGELAALGAENARRAAELAATRAELERTLADLQTSYWHLRRIQEVLPICLECRRVKTDDARWEDVVDFLKQNASFLSHGYCPDCAVVVRARLRAETASRG